MITAIPHTLATHGWWVASRASGLLALVLVTISVGIGLTMAGRPIRRPGLSKKLLAIHEQTALAALAAIGVHGLGLVLDPWLQPGVACVAVPFGIAVNTFWTGLGTIAGYLALLLGLSFYVRRWVGPQLWRKAHRATVVVYLLGLINALGAGTDTSSALFRIWALATGVPIALLFVYRLGTARRAERRRELSERAAQWRDSKDIYEQPLTVR